MCITHSQQYLNSLETTSKTETKNSGKQDSEQEKTEVQSPVVVNDPSSEKVEDDNEVPGNQAVTVTVSSAEELEPEKGITISESLR